MDSIGRWLRVSVRLSGRSWADSLCVLSAYFVEKLCVASVKELDFRKSHKGYRLIADLDLLSLCI